MSATPAAASPLPRAGEGQGEGGATLPAITRAPRWHHHLPTALHALVAATAERHRHGQVSTATVAILAAELEHAAIWYAHQPGAVTISITDLAETAARLAEIAGTGDPT